MFWLFSMLLISLPSGGLYGHGIFRYNQILICLLTWYTASVVVRIHSGTSWLYEGSVHSSLPHIDSITKNTKLKNSLSHKNYFITIDPSVQFWQLVWWNGKEVHSAVCYKPKASSEFRKSVHVIGSEARWLFSWSPDFTWKNNLRQTEVFMWRLKF